MKKFERLSAICLAVMLYCSCSSVVSLDTLPEPEQFLDIPKEVLLSGQELDEEQQEVFTEARARFLSNVETTDEGTRIVDKSAADIHICQDLYDLFHIVYVTLPNSREACLQDNITKSGGVGCVWENADSLLYDCDDTSCVIVPTPDMIAGIIYEYCGNRGWNTTAKFWNMFYFQNRTDAYCLDIYEWEEVKAEAEKQYRHSWGKGPHQISFSLDKDLHYSYNTATAYFDSNGNCIGFKDTYDMNSMRGQRDGVDELITELLGLLGGSRSGYEIFYGDCR